MKKEYDEKKEHLTDFSQRIRRQREYFGISQEIAAERLGLSTNFYGKVERGVHGLSYDSLKKVKEVFGVSIDYIITGEIVSEIQSPIIDIINRAPEEKRIYLEQIFISASKLYDDKKE